MSIRSKIRDWIYPAKEDAFDDSYDYLLQFFNTLDEEFGGATDFLFDQRIHKFFRTSTEIENSGGTAGQIGLYIRTGDLYKYSVSNVWEKFDRLGRLPKIREADPTKDDIGLYDEGETWINSKSGRVFKYTGKTLVSTLPDVYEGIWKDQQGKIPYATSTVRQFLFYPGINLTYKTKRLSNIDGIFTFDDGALHIEGVIGNDGVVQHFEYDTHIDVFIQGYQLGTLLIKRTKVQTLMDLEYFNPDGGLPSHSDPEIYPWYARFERMLGVLEISSKVNPDLARELRTDMVWTAPIEQIMEDQSYYNQFFDTNSHIMISEVDMLEIKERYRSFFAATTDQEMSMAQKSWAMYLLGQCIAWEAYDGNIYYIDGSTMLADGNVEPSC